MISSKNLKSVFFLFALLFCFNILAWIAVSDLNKLPLLEVIFFDVGQGDAIFIETPQKHQILIDGGPSPLVLERLGESLPFWDKTLDLIILTHPEHDHISGLIEVLKRYKVENILWTGIVRDTADYEEWKKLIEKEKAKIFIAQAGQKILWKSGSDNFISILYPFENLEDQVVKNTNNTSIIAKLIFGENSFLFTGDAYKSVERELLERGVKVNSDVLKVGHHGSKTSSSKEFIEQVSPEMAIISAGKENRYGHPYQEVLETLEKYDIKILRTDEKGDIKIISDGKNLIIK